MLEPIKTPEQAIAAANAFSELQRVTVAPLIALPLRVGTEDVTPFLGERNAGKGAWRVEYSHVTLKFASAKPGFADRYRRSTRYRAPNFPDTRFCSDACHRRAGRYSSASEASRPRARHSRRRSRRAMEGWHLYRLGLFPPRQYRGSGRHRKRPHRLRRHFAMPDALLLLGHRSPAAAGR